MESKPTEVRMLRPSQTILSQVDKTIEQAGIHFKPVRDIDLNRSRRQRGNPRSDLLR